MPPNIILASSSPFRKSLLERLHLEFKSIAPDINEISDRGESAEDYVCRLARQKAEAIAEKHPSAIVIGSDQCALLDGQILGKPGNHKNALKQLKNAQGKTVVFHTGICVMQQSIDSRIVWAPLLALLSGIRWLRVCSNQGFFLSIGT